MKLLVITSNHLRHKFFANSLAKNFNVVGLIMEEKKHNPQNSADGTDLEYLVHNFFIDRDRSEFDFFNKDEKILIPQEKILNVAAGSINSPEVITKIKEWNADYVAVFGSSILKEEIINLFPVQRIINLHLGLSPYYRGCATNFWPLYEGKPEYVGATIHYLDAGIDSGKIIGQITPKIDNYDTPHSIGNKTIELGVSLMVDIFKHLAKGGQCGGSIQKIDQGNLYLFKNFQPQHLKYLIDNWHAIVNNYLNDRENRHIQIVKYTNDNQENDFSKISKIFETHSPFIIAEIGKNFIQTEDDREPEEYLDNAKQLVLAAKTAGADAVKFQTHNLEDEQLNIDIISPHFSGSDRYNWVKRNNNATPFEFWVKLKEFCDENGIMFFSTPMSRGAAKILERLDVPMWKIGSGDILDFPMLDYIASTNKPIIISTGMSTLEEVDKAINFLKKRTDKIIILHCVSKYPCPKEELNLNTIRFLQKRYNLPVGFSDHSIGHESVLAAVNLGAKVIEKHFSFDRSLWGSDHKSSMTPDEFKSMVEDIRNDKITDWNSYGQENKILNIDESQFRPIFRKALVAGENIKKGEIIKSDMVYAMRPQKYIKGLPSEEYENVIGQIANKDFNKYDPINLIDLKPKKRKICFVITSKIHYARNKLIMQELKKREDIELQIILGASAILKQYGDVETWLKEDGFSADAKIIMNIEGGDNMAMTKTAGLGLIEFASALDKLDPDLVVVRGDRYEVLSAAIATVYMNKHLAHIEGGDVSGTIDESVRHAITKLAHIHFTTNEESMRRVLKMGENPDYVFNYGSPDVEFAALSDAIITSDDINRIGVGTRSFDINEQFIMVMQHPVTTEVGKNRDNVIETLKAIVDLKIPTIWFWPNIDAGNDEIASAIRKFRENTDINNYTHFIKYLPPEKFIALLRKTSCLVGNSSAGIKESSFLGVPVVNIGTRQNGRTRAVNVIDADYDYDQIRDAINKQIAVKNSLVSSDIYYKKDSSKKISKTLAEIDLYLQKSFFN